MVQKLSHDLHEALIKIARTGAIMLEDEIAINLHSMDYIKYEFGAKWVISKKGIHYLIESTQDKAKIKRFLRESI
jgi:hypothetical protein